MSSLNGVRLVEDSITTLAALLTPLAKEEEEQEEQERGGAIRFPLSLLLAQGWDLLDLLTLGQLAINER